VFVGLALSMFPMSPSVFGKGDPAGKLRRRIQDYERARRALVVYTKTHAEQARDASGRRSSSMCLSRSER
jgi:hypothetical protein